MTKEKERTRNSSPYIRAQNGTAARGSGKDILAEYERGTRIAGWLFCALFLFLAAGSVMFGW